MNNEAVDSASRVKRSGWFAAGKEVSTALGILSDGAFKLYMLLCLQAERNTGSLYLSYSSAAGALNKSRRSIVSYFAELRECGVCVVHVAANEHERTQVEICDEFWPYSRRARAEQSTKEQHAFLTAVKSMLDARACVACTWAPVDIKFAIALHATGCTVQTVERAILLACTRKYMSAAERGKAEPILTLPYFREVIDEIRNADVSPDYWDHVRRKLLQLERTQKHFSKRRLCGDGTQSPR